jgi:hypothetical protein
MGVASVGDSLSDSLGRHLPHRAWGQQSVHTVQKTLAQSAFALSVTHSVVHLQRRSCAEEEQIAHMVQRPLAQGMVETYR